MSKKLTHLFSFILVLGLFLTSGTNAADPSLIGWWKLDEGAGTTVADASGRRHNGLFVEGTPEWVDGMYGKALKFDGVNKVEIPDHADFHLEDAVSVALWANPEAVQVEDAKFFIKQKSGYYPYCLQYDGNSQTIYANVSSDSAQFNTKPRLANFPGQWAHLCFTYDGNALILYKDGEEVARVDASGKLRQNDLSLTIGGRLNQTSSNNFKGIIDDVRLYNRALTQEEIKQVMLSPIPSPALASNPNPANEATDVPRDVVLSWTPGELAAQTNGHKVYFSESFNDVNDGIGAITQSASVYAVPQRLDFSTTYYWRVDEVDGPPDLTVHKGNIWRFTTEPLAYVIENVTATASSSSPLKGPENTVNGSGLDATGLLHGKDGDDTMWLSNMTGPQPTWIELEFDKVHKLHEMWVWNSNESLETMIGVGFKDVTIEYSVNGIDYATLGTTHEFAQAPGTPDYAHNTTVDFGGAAVKYVRLTANSNWAGFFPQFGLSEVRFFSIPVNAKEPSPASGTTDVDLDVVLSWVAGREADKHDIYVSSDEQAVVDGNAPVTTVTETSYGPLSLDLAQTYYWRVDEVNDAETPATWQGGIWDFSTKEFLVVDDFEDYNEFEPFTVYNTWTDGYQDTTNGSTIGYVLGNPQETINVHGGKQSVPIMYDNSVASFSEVAVNPDALAIGRDWNKGGIKTLSLWFSGAAGNIAAQMYVKINSSKVAYDGDASNLTVAAWQPWNIDLTSFGAGLQNVTKLAIGIDGVGAKGTLLLDDIRLYPYERQFITPVEPDNVGLVGHYKLDQDATDSSGNNNHGTMGGDPKWTTGKIGGALNFDGDDYVDLGNPSQLDFGTASWSVSAWIKMPATTDNRNIFAKGGDDTGGIRYMLNVNESEDHKACLTVDDDATKVQSTSSVTVDDDQWHHIIGIRDGSSLLLYVDGALDGTNTLSAGYDLSGTSQANAYIGTGWKYDTSVLNKFFIGVIDDVRIYARVLTEEEIVWLSGRTKPFDKPF